MLLESLHGVISLPEATSCDKKIVNVFQGQLGLLQEISQTKDEVILSARRVIESVGPQIL